MLNMYLLVNDSFPIFEVMCSTQYIEMNSFHSVSEFRFHQMACVHHVVLVIQQNTKSNYSKVIIS